LTTRQAKSCGNVKSCRENSLLYVGRDWQAKWWAIRITFRGDLHVSMTNDVRHLSGSKATRPPEKRD
jgi:hypothetical protein